MKVVMAIKKLMENKHMTAYALSKKSGISQSTLSNIIKRGNDPTLDTLIKICHGLDVSLSEFAMYMETEDEDHQKEILKDMEYRELMKKFMTLSQEDKKYVSRLIHIFAK